MSKETKTEILKRKVPRITRRRLANVAMSLTAATAPALEVASTAAADQAATTSRANAAEVSVGKKIPELKGPATAQEKKVNTSAQKGMNLLAHRFLHGKLAKASEHGAKQHDNAPDMDGNATTTLTLKVPAPSLYGEKSQNSAYEFDVTTKMARGGKPDLDNVVSIFAAQGEVDPQSGNFVKTLASLNMSASKVTNMISVSGVYASPKSPDYTTINAAVIPGTFLDGSHEMRLTSERLVDTVEQFGEFAKSAINKEPVGAREAAFGQPVSSGTSSMSTTVHA